MGFRTLADAEFEGQGGLGFCGFRFQDLWLLAI